VPSERSAAPVADAAEDVWAWSAGEAAPLEAPLRWCELLREGGKGERGRGAMVAGWCVVGAVVLAAASDRLRSEVGVLSSTALVLLALGFGVACSEAICACCCRISARRRFCETAC